LKTKRQEPLRKRLAEMGFVYDGIRINYESSRRKRQEHIDSGMWKVPKKAKRLKLTDF